MNITHLLNLSSMFIILCIITFFVTRSILNNDNKTLFSQKNQALKNVFIENIERFGFSIALDSNFNSNNSKIDSIITPFKLENEMLVLVYDYNSSLLAKNNADSIQYSVHKLPWGLDEEDNKTIKIDMKNQLIIQQLNLPGKKMVLLIVEKYYESNISVLHKLKNLFVLYFFLFLIFSFSILIYNNRLMIPLSDILKSYGLNSNFKIVKSKKGNDLELIGKYINSLENQIVMYDKKVEQLSQSRLNLENDLNMAKKIQNNLLPNLIQFKKWEKNFELYAHSESAYDIGGDFYDCFMIDNKHLLIAVADVSGKGIAAALYMTFAHSVLHSISDSELPINQLVEKLNDKLIAENVSEMFITIFIGIMNIETGNFDYCNAAHCYPILIKGEGGITELSASHGIPLGIFPNRTYESSSIVLSEGDQIVVFTDGLTDTTDENGLKYTTDVLRYNLLGAWFSSAKDIVVHIAKSINLFSGNTKPVDDLTILTLKYLGKK
jgi:serine phosphatase RsbU (regulator of sigma subunit)